MRVIAVIDQRAVVERILRHLHLWGGTPPLAPARSPHKMKQAISRGEPSDDVVPVRDYGYVITYSLVSSNERRGVAGLGDSCE